MLKFKFKRSELSQTAKELNKVLGIVPAIDTSSTLGVLEDLVIEAVKLIEPKDEFTEPTRVIIATVIDYLNSIEVAVETPKAEPKEVPVEKPKGKKGRPKKVVTEEAPVEEVPVEEVPVEEVIDAIAVPVVEEEKEEVVPKELKTPSSAPVGKSKEKAEPEAPEEKKTRVQDLDAYGFRSCTAASAAANHLMAGESQAQVVAHLMKDFNKIERLCFDRTHRVIGLLLKRGFMTIRPDGSATSYPQFVKIQAGLAVARKPVDPILRKKAAEEAKIKAREARAKAKKLEAEQKFIDPPEAVPEAEIVGGKGKAKGKAKG